MTSSLVARVSEEVEVLDGEGADDRALSRTAAVAEPYVSPRTQPASPHGCDDRDGCLSVVWTTITESVYRHQLRPVRLNGAVVMDQTFGVDPGEA